MNKNLRMIILTGILFLASFTIVIAHDEGFENQVVNEKIMIDDKAAETLGLETEKVQEKEIDDVIFATGKIEEVLKNNFVVNAPVSGEVVSVHVHLGNMLKKGNPIIVMRSADISRLQGEIDQISAELDLANKNYERDKFLYEKQVSSKKDLDISESILKSTEAKLNAAKNNLNILTGTSYNSMTGTFTLKSSFVGTIVEGSISPGQILAQNQIIFKGIDLSEVWINADIFEKDINKVVLGQKVLLELEGLEGKTLEGKITYIGSVIDKNTRTLPVKATIKNINEILKPGEFAEVKIYSGKRKNLIIIPQSALAETDEEDIGDKHDHVVYVKEKDNYVPRTIQVELHDSDSISVLSGLMDGEEIVTQGTYQLQYGKIEDSKIGMHNHEEDQNEKNKISIWMAVLFGIVGILFGVVIGKNKTNK